MFLVINARVLLDFVMLLRVLHIRAVTRRQLMTWRHTGSRLWITVYANMQRHITLASLHPASFQSLRCIRKAPRIQTFLLLVLLFSLHFLIC